MERRPAPTLPPATPCRSARREKRAARENAAARKDCGLPRNLRRLVVIHSHVAPPWRLGCQPYSEVLPVPRCLRRPSHLGESSKSWHREEFNRANISKRFTPHRRLDSQYVALGDSGVVDTRIPIVSIVYIDECCPTQP